MHNIIIAYLFINSVKLKIITGPYPARPIGWCFVLKLQIDCTHGVGVHKIPRSHDHPSEALIGLVSVLGSLRALSENWLLF